MSLMDSAGDGWSSWTTLGIENSNGDVEASLTLATSGSSGGSAEDFEVCLLGGCFEGVVTGSLSSQESWSFSPIVEAAGAGSTSFCISPTTTVCDIGKEPNFEDDGCVPCAAGKFSNSSDTMLCLRCAVGSYSSAGDLTAEGECLQCPPGKANAEVEARSSVFCLDCAAGESTGGQAGQAACVDCLAGKYTGEVASTECVLCVPGTMSAVDKSEACTDCPAGEYSGGGSSACR